MSWIDIENEEVNAAVGGNSAALEHILGATQDPVFNLALRFLWHPHDAQDATQEILIRVMTNLGSFRGESAFGTWAYRIAVNHLLRVKKSRMERREISFRNTSVEMQTLDPEPLENGETDRAYDVKIACTNGILLALKRKYRIAFVLGAVMEMKSEVAADILQISPAAFRQQLARSRKAMTEFMGRQCGLVNANASCGCAKRVRPALERGVIAPYVALAENMKRSGDFNAIERKLGAEISTLERTVMLYRMNSDYRAPEILGRRIKEVLAGNIFAGE